MARMIISNLGKIELMPEQDAYALDVQAVRDSFKGVKIPEAHLHRRVDGIEMARPFTIKEDIAARVEAFNTGADEEERLRLFNSSLYSCTGIVTQGGTGKYKIVPLCEKLIEIPSDFNKLHWNTEYTSFDFPEFDNDKQPKQNMLIKEQVIEHPGWLAVVEEDRKLLGEYCDIVFPLLGEIDGVVRGMYFFTLNGRAENDRISPAILCDLSGFSCIAGGTLRTLASFKVK